MLHGAVFLADLLSRSRPSRLGRSLRSRRTRSASPPLDTVATRQGAAPIEEDGGQARARPGLGTTRKLGKLRSSTLGRGRRGPAPHSGSGRSADCRAPSASRHAGRSWRAPPASSCVTLSLAWPPGGVLVPLPRRPVVGDASSRFTACERSLKPVWPRPNAGAKR